MSYIYIPNKINFIFITLIGLNNYKNLTDVKFSSQMC